MIPSRRALCLGVVALAGAAAVAGIFAPPRSSAEPPGPGASERASPARIVLLISIDTLRPDHLGVYGYGRPTSPSIDAVAAEGTTFVDASTPAPWTLPAHVSMLTGLYPSRHRVVRDDQSLPSDITPLAVLLAQRGYRTAAVVNSQNLGPAHGLERGFERFRYVEEVGSRVEPTSEIVDQAIAWLKEESGPIFLFVHTYDVHSDYRARAPYVGEFARPYAGEADGSTAQLLAFREGKVHLGPRDAEHLIDLYDAGIRQTDEEVGRLVRFLRDSKRLDETLLIVTSDHGEEFLEHGGVLHGRTQYQELIAVPLIMRGPRIARGRRIEDPVNLIDLVPTVLSLQGAPIPPGLDGIDVSSLRSVTNGHAGERAVGKSPGERLIFAEADHHNAEPDQRRAVRRGRFKLHLDRSNQTRALYDLASDPHEHTDVAASEPQVAAELGDALQQFVNSSPARPAPSPALSAEQIEKLRSLGYVVE